MIQPRTSAIYRAIQKPISWVELEPGDHIYVRTHEGDFKFEAELVLADNGFLACRLVNREGRFNQVATFED